MNRGLKWEIEEQRNIEYKTIPLLQTEGNVYI